MLPNGLAHIPHKQSDGRQGNVDFQTHPSLSEDLLQNPESSQRGMIAPQLVRDLLVLQAQLTYKLNSLQGETNLELPPIAIDHMLKGNLAHHI
jgi:hypothetical protein